MEAFTMEIAGAVFCVQPLFQSTKEYCREYLTDLRPGFFINISPEELEAEQRALEREAVEEGLKIRKFPDPFLERSVIQRRVADCLVAQDTLMMHGSTICVDGEAFLFTAPCGTGKSTHTRLWRALFGQRAVMVNDDKPFLKITDKGVFACGSPWGGKHGLSTNICVPLKGICLLHRSLDNRIFPADAHTMSDYLPRQIYMPPDHALAEKVASLLECLLNRAALWELHCNRNSEAARISYCAMSGKLL